MAFTCAVQYPGTNPLWFCKHWAGRRGKELFVFSGVRGAGLWDSSPLESQVVPIREGLLCGS